MQFQEFDSLSGYGINGLVILAKRNQRDIAKFLHCFLIKKKIKNSTHACSRYEMVINNGATASHLISSFSTRARGIIVKCCAFDHSLYILVTNALLSKSLLSKYCQRLCGFDILCDPSFPDKRKINFL